MPVRSGSRRSCGDCGADVPEGARFCAACGRSFVARPDAPEAVAPAPRRGPFRHRRFASLMGVFAVIIGLGIATRPATSAAPPAGATGPAGNAAPVDSYVQNADRVAGQWDSAIAEMNAASTAASAITDAFAAQTITLYEAKTQLGSADTRIVAATRTIDALPDVPALDKAIFAELRDGADQYSDGITLVVTGLDANNTTLLGQGMVKVQQASRSWQAGIAGLKKAGT